MNRKKVEEYSTLLRDSATILQSDTELWKQFLHFATQFTHYRFRDQLLIYAQNQQATACATFAQWKKIGRYVRSGEHSIVLLDETGNRPRLRHIFDVTSTGPTQEFAYKPKPILPEEREELAKRLSTSYARENSLYAADAKRWDNNLEQTLSQVAMYMTQEYYGVSLEQAMEQSGKDEFPAYYVATATSAMYLLLSKYGFEQEANQLDFSCMSQLDEQSFENVGTAASAILSRTARMVRQIHPQIQRESQKQTERSESYEKDDNGRSAQENHLSSGGGLHGTGHRAAGGRGGRTGTEEIRNDEKEISGGESISAVRANGDERDSVSRNEEGGRSSRPDQEADVTETGSGCAILVREEFSCLEFIMNRDTINWILKKLNTGGRTWSIYQRKSIKTESATRWWETTTSPIWSYRRKAAPLGGGAGCTKRFCKNTGPASTMPCFCRENSGHILLT